MIDLTDRFSRICDDRGFIQDLVAETEIKAVTQIYSSNGAIRANHYHNLTQQYNFVAYGCVDLAYRSDFNSSTRIDRFSTGSFFLIEEKEHHALRFTENTLLIVMTIGPRAGKEYESDTYRLPSCLFA